MSHLMPASQRQVVVRILSKELSTSWWFPFVLFTKATDVAFCQQIILPACFWFCLLCYVNKWVVVEWKLGLVVRAQKWNPETPGLESWFSSSLCLSFSAYEICMLVTMLLQINPVRLNRAVFKKRLGNESGRRRENLASETALVTPRVGERDDCIHTTNSVS